MAAHTLRNLGAAPHAPVLLFTAGIEPDGMSNVTRTAPIFRYLLENYRLAFPVESGQALLLPRETPVRWRERRIDMAPITFEPLEGRGLSVPVLTDACRASDLLLLRLRIARTAMFGFRKPGRAFAMLVLDDGQRIVRPFPTSTDGEPYEVLLTGMELNDPLLLAAFATERGRLVSQQRVQEIQLAWRPLDLLSVQPAEMEILGLSVLTPEEPPRPGTAMQIDAVTEIALDQRWQPSVWRKFFQQSPPRPAQPR